MRLAKGENEQVSKRHHEPPVLVTRESQPFPILPKDMVNTDVRFVWLVLVENSGVQAYSTVSHVQLSVVTRAMHPGHLAPRAGLTAYWHGPCQLFRVLSRVLIHLQDNAGEFSVSLPVDARPPCWPSPNQVFVQACKL